MSRHFFYTHLLAVLSVWCGSSPTASAQFFINSSSASASGDGFASAVGQFGDSYPRPPEDPTINGTPVVGSAGGASDSGAIDTIGGGIITGVANAGGASNANTIFATGMTTGSLQAIAGVTAVGGGIDNLTTSSNATTSDSYLPATQQPQPFLTGGFGFRANHAANANANGTVINNPELPGFTIVGLTYVAVSGGCQNSLNASCEATGSATATVEATTTTVDLQSGGPLTDFQTFRVIGDGIAGINVNANVTAHAEGSGIAGFDGINNVNAGAVSTSVAGAYAWLVPNPQTLIPNDLFEGPVLTGPAGGTAGAATQRGFAYGPDSDFRGETDFDGIIGTADIDNLQRHVRLELPQTGNPSVFADLLRDANGDVMLDANGDATEIPGANPFFDLNRDTVVDQGDVDHLVEVVLGTAYGDIDLDGDVDISDFGVFVGNFNQPGNFGWLQGDFDGDGDVDGGDFGVFVGNFGFVRGSSSPVAVPEPAAGAMLMAIAGALATRRRRGA